MQLLDQQGASSPNQAIFGYPGARLTATRPPKPAIVISPSQLSTFDRCRRRWAWENIAGFRSPPTPSQLLGTRVHAVLEKWLANGEPPDRKTLEGRIAVMGVPYLPSPGTGKVEEQFYLTTRRGLHYTGIADWLGWDPEVGALVIDHKTTSNLKWAKTKEELEYDVQALLYANYACISLQTDHVALLWNYLQTDAKNSKLVESTLRLEQIVERFPIVEDKAAEMTALRKASTHPLRVLPNPDACGDFGGCPHQARCKLSASEKMEAIMVNEQNGTMRELMEKMSNYNNSGIPAYVPQGPNGQSLSQPQQPAQPPASQVAPFYQDPSSGYLVDAHTRQLLAANHPAYQYPQSYQQYQVAPPSAGNPPPSQQAAPQQAAPQQAAPQQAAPPQRQPVTTQAPPQPPAAQAPSYSPHSGPNAPEQHANPAEIPASIPAPEVEGAPVKKKRGRRTNAEIAAAKLAEAGGPIPAAMQAASAGRQAPSVVAPIELVNAVEVVGGITGEQLAFVMALNGAMSNPAFNGSLTLEQLAYIGDLARQAFNKAFGET